MDVSWRLLDVCIDARATEALIRQCVDATSSHTLSHTAASDASRLAFAADADHTIPTHDSDFIAENERRLAMGHHPAGVLLVPDRADLRWLLRALRHAIERWTPDEWRDPVRWLLSPPDEEIG